MKKMLKKSLVCFMVIALLLSSLVISASAVSGSEIVSYARQFVGCAYVSGGKGPSSFDCSGFVYYVFKHFGISLPSASSPYWSNPTNYGTVIATGSTSQAKAGDIIVWSGHVAIYTENGYCVEALNSKYGVTDRFKVNDHTNGMNYKVLRIYGVGDGYTLSYDANGGSGAPAAQTGASSYTITSTIPTRFGWTFAGWSTSSSATSSSYSPGNSIYLSSNTTLYAVWETKTLTTESNLSSAANYILYSGQELYYKFIPQSSGYHLFESSNPNEDIDIISYLYDSAGNQLAYNDNRTSDSRNSRIVHYLTAGITYYIKLTAWSGQIGYTYFQIVKIPELHYNANGGSGAPSTQVETNWLLYNDNYTISSTRPTRTNYTFLGWSTNSNATSADYQPGSSIKINYYNDGLTLYAVWQKNAVATTYTLTYNANGGSGAPSSQTGSTSYAISPTVPHRVGYTFLGWSTSSSGSSGNYIFGNTITLSSNTTLYASWQEARTVNTSSSNLANINFENQVRAYKFVPSSSGTYIFESTGSTDSKIYLYNSSGTELANNDDGGNGNNFKLSYNLNAGSTYYLGVRIHSTGTGEVSFTVKKESSSQGSTNKCPYCNNIFTNESEYNKHLANCDGYFNNNNNISVTIRNNPGTRTLNYGDTVRIYADAQNLPAGAKIGWYVDDGSTISAKVSSDNTYCDITATGTGTVTLAAKAVDANGNVMTDSNGYQIADVQKINTKTSLWLRIVSFFKNLFGMNRTTVQLFKGLF